MTLRNGSSASLCRLLEVVVGLIFVSGCGGSGGGGGSTPPPLEPNVSLSPTSLALGNQAVGSTSAPQTITLSNTGNAALSLSSIAITGANAGDFALTNTCGNSVGAGSSCTISVMFTPTASGSRTASVTIADNAAGSPQTISLTGTGVTSLVSLSAKSLTFETQTLGTTSAAQTVTVSNSGSASLSLAGIAITGASAGDFAETNTCGSSLGGGGTCTISVTFTPTMDGSRSAAIAITDSAAGSPQAVSLTGTGKGQFMALSADKTHLVNTITNTPVFITGDAPQTLAVQVSSIDVNTYLSDRAARGFNAIWVILADGGPSCDQTNCPDNYYGYPPFDVADFTNEDDDYWANVDSVIQAAKGYGITVFANPMFVGEAGGYYENSILASSDAVITAYGAWVGNRYKDYPNIVWLLGGDTDFSVTGLPQKMGDLAAGIASADANHLMLLEPIRNQSSAQVWNQSTPLTLNWVYPDYSHSQSLCASNYASYHATIPSLMGEDGYEGGNSLTPLQIREETYWEVLSGCTLGRIFGNDAIWTMGGPKDSMGQTWQSQLGSPGSVAEAWQGALMRSREFWLLVPDTNNSVLVSGYGSGSTLSVAARSSDGQSIIAYIPAGNAATITIDMSRITSPTGTAKCWWFNPSTGATTLIGTFATSGTQNLTPPDANDWVLVIDDASANLAAPGGR